MWDVRSLKWSKELAENDMKSENHRDKIRYNKLEQKEKKARERERYGRI